MRKLILIIVLLIAWERTMAQADETAQLMLNIEKLAQFKQILTDLKKGYEVVNKGYGTIKDISEGNFNLHQTFLDGLLQVSPVVRKYKRITEIIDNQVLLVRSYKSALSRFQRSDVFHTTELRHIEQVYGRVLEESLHNLEELSNVVTAGKLRMGDDERLKAIDQVHASINDKLDFVRQFNHRTTLLALHREQDKRDAVRMKKLYVIN